MEPGKMKDWFTLAKEVFSAGREALSFARDAMTTRKEYREYVKPPKPEEPSKEEPKK